MRTAKRWYHHWLLWILALLAVAVFFGWRKAKGRYQRWNAGRQVRHAAVSIAEGDYRHAMIEARSALGTNPMDPDATRIMAEALEKTGVRRLRRNGGTASIPSCPATRRTSWRGLWIR